MIRPRYLLLTLVATTALTACNDDWMPGKPKREDAWQDPATITDPEELYAENCRGCHAMEKGTVAGSLSLNNPTYLALLTPDILRNVIAKGVRGTTMPGFSQAVGGGLTDQQIDIIVDYVLKHQTPVAGPLPPYSAPIGDPVAGRAAFQVSCASCHGPDGAGLAGKAGSVVKPAYVGMVTDQYLRSIVIGGRPELGCPDFRSRVPGQQMADADIANVVAWLGTHRTNEYGLPLVPQPTPLP